MNITFEQEVKLQLVLLAEYLQCKPLSDAQVIMYAEELRPLGPDGLAKAIALLKADPDVWAGRMPLPAKLKQYVQGDLTVIASNSARKVMALTSVREAYDTLFPWELAVAKEYGLNTIVGRLAEQTPTIFAQVRDGIRAYLRDQREKEVPRGLPRDRDTLGIGSREDPGYMEQDERGRELEAGPSGDG